MDIYFPDDMNTMKYCAKCQRKIHSKTFIYKRKKGEDIVVSMCELFFF